jgi:hypothetical protein
MLPVVLHAFFSVFKMGILFYISIFYYGCLPIRILDVPVLVRLQSLINHYLSQTIPWSIVFVEKLKVVQQIFQILLNQEFIALQQNSLTTIFRMPMKPQHFHMVIDCLVTGRVHAVVIVNFGITFFCVNL